MITVKEFQNKTFESKEDLFRELKANKSKLIASKMAVVKECDSIEYVVSKSNGAVKELSNDVSEINVKAVANSCGWLDSHNDVHLEGCWNKTASEKSAFYHLKQHQNDIDSILSYDAEKSVEDIDIYYNGVKHRVNALIGSSTLDKEDNPSVFKKYLKNKIRQHSVGMMYVKGKIYLCINSDHEDYAEEKQMWDKYRPQVINGEKADEQGFFWGIAEAKGIEFSCVGLGSNSQTPTISVTEVKNEPSNDTQKTIEPTQVTQSELGNFYKTLLN